MLHEVSDFMSYYFKLINDIQTTEQGTTILVIPVRAFEQVFIDLNFDSERTPNDVVEDVITLLRQEFEEIFDFDYLIEMDQITLIPLFK